MDLKVLSWTCGSYNGLVGVKTDLRVLCWTCGSYTGLEGFITDLWVLRWTCGSYNGLVVLCWTWCRTGFEKHGMVWYWNWCCSGLEGLIMDLKVL